MGTVVELEQAEDKRTMLETISAYEGRIEELENQVEVLKFGLGVLRTTVKEMM